MAGDWIEEYGGWVTFFEASLSAVTFLGRTAVEAAQQST